MLVLAGAILISTACRAQRAAPEGETLYAERCTLYRRGRGRPHHTFMPELPEVETIARGLDKRVRGDVIESVWIGKRHQPLKSPAKEIARTLEGARIAAV